MLLMREVSTEDLDSLWNLIGQASVGLTTLKIDQEQLADRLERSQFAFSRKSEKAEGAPYVFVMEDTDSKRLVGTSCVFSKTGGFEPFYGYRIVSEHHQCELLNQRREITSLHLTKIHNGPTELGSLFLLPQFRGGGAGKLLSFSRFVYMAAHPKRFANDTIAEMRGFSDEHGQSPVWNAIGAHFFRIDFPKADSLSMIDKQFIEDLMPRHPIYLELLPADAIAAIGRVHPQTEPALAMLQSQGFKPTDMVDIFDGGPIIQCKTSQIKAVAETRTLTVQVELSLDRAESSRHLIARANSPFRAIQTQVCFDDSNTLKLEAMDAEVLQVVSGDPILVL